MTSRSCGQAWRRNPNAFNVAQLLRHVGNKVVEWPIAAIVYPLIGYLGWHFAYWYADRPLLFVLGVALPSISLGLSIWVGGIVTQDMIESLTPYCPRPLSIARTTAVGEVLGHVPNPDLLAAGHARRVACPVGPRPHRPLRGRQDRPGPSRPHPLVPVVA